jgi:hypothetical protein
MATTTTNFGWDIPQSTDLVKDGATAIAALGQDIDTALVDLKGGTTGQVLAKASGTDLDFSWVAQDDSNAIQNAIVDAKGDLIGATAADTPARLAVGTNGQVLTADSTAATGLKWGTPASGLTLVKTQTIGTGVSSVTVTDAFSSTYDAYRVTMTGGAASGSIELILTLGATTSGYKWGFSYGVWSTSFGTAGSSSDSGIYAFRATADGMNNAFDVSSPNLAKHTAVEGYAIETGQYNLVRGVVPNTTQYTAFTITTGSGTLSGGTIRVYGYQNS